MIVDPLIPQMGIENIRQNASGFWIFWQTSNKEYVLSYIYFLPFRIFFLVSFFSALNRYCVFFWVVKLFVLWKKMYVQSHNTLASVY